MIIYGFFCYMYPRFFPQKTRKEEDMLLVTNINLELIILNDTARCFLEKADGSMCTEDIVQQMLHEYDVGEAQLKDDVCRMIRDLQWKDLLYFSKTPARSNE